MVNTHWWIKHGFGSECCSGALAWQFFEWWLLKLDEGHFEGKIPRYVLH